MTWTNLQTIWRTNCKFQTEVKGSKSWLWSRTHSLSELKPAEVFSFSKSTIQKVPLLWLQTCWNDRGWPKKLLIKSKFFIVIIKKKEKKDSKDYLGFRRNNHVANRLLLCNLCNFMLLTNISIKKIKLNFKVCQPKTKIVYCSRAQRKSFSVCMHNSVKL